MQNGSRDSAFFQPQLLERNYGENVEQQLGQADRGERCLLAKVLHEWIETLESFKVKQLSQSVLGDGPTSGSEEIYWLAVQVPVSYSGKSVYLDVLGV